MNQTERLKCILRKRYTIDGKFNEAERKFNALSITNIDTKEKLAYLLEKFSQENYNYLLPTDILCRPKDDVQSKKLREQGNQLFENKSDVNLYAALELYNESLCFSTINSENLSFGYANRSAVYLEWKMYDVCLENIQLARATNGFPVERLAEKLKQREKECRRFIKMVKKGKKESEKVKFEPKLSGPAHPNCPFIQNCMELCRNEQYGRYVIATRTIKPGEVIAIENGFLNRVNNTSRYQRCQNCLAEHNLSLIPCNTCTNAMFCSVNCIEAAKNNNYHQYECSVIDYISTTFSPIQLLAIITAMKAFTCFESKTSALMEFLDKYEHIEVNPFSGYKYTDPLTYEQEILHQVNNLVTNLSKRLDLFRLASIASIAFQLLMQQTEFGRCLITTPKERERLFGLIFQYILMLEENGHSLGTAEVYASGIYPFVSMLSHSCAPNIFRIVYGTKMVLIAACTIQKGEQVVDSYGCLHTDQTFAERQHKLQTQYHFRCECDACKNNYAIKSELAKSNIPLIISDTDRKHIKDINRRYARDNIGRLNAYLAKYDTLNLYPCWELVQTRQYLECFYILLADNEPLKMRYRGYC